MIKIFYGDNRVLAQQEIIKFFGTHDYEIIEGGNLTPTDLPSIFLGHSLFDNNERKILIRDFFSNVDTAELLPNYLETPHQVVLLESKLDTRTNAFKAVKNQIESRKFTLPEPDKWLNFEIYRTAKTNGPKAVKLLQKIGNTSQPRLFVGFLATQAMKEYAKHPGIKEKRVLRELSKLDHDIRLVTGADATSQRPWLLLQAFLLRLSSL